MDTDNIAIYEKDLLAAHRICAPISDDDRRNKAVANVLAAKIASGFFSNGDYELDDITGLHNIAFVCEQFELADIYVNDAFVDVCVYFSDEEMCVPKVHFDTGILPVAYMFVKLSSDLKQAYVSGFMYPESVDKSKLNGDVYAVTQNDLCTFYDVEMRLHKSNETVNISDLQLYELIEGSLTDEDVINVFRQLIKSKNLREKLIKAVKAQFAFNFISISAKDEADRETLQEQEVLSQESEKSNEAEEVDLTEEDLDSLFAAEDEASIEDSVNEDIVYSTEVTPSGSEVIESLDREELSEENSKVESAEQIDNLFNGEQEGVPVQKKKNSFLPVLLLVLLLCGAGYFFYTSHQNQTANEELIPSQTDAADLASDASAEVSDEEPAQAKEVAMPVESVEDNKPVVNKEEANAVVIPAIERNLDASVLVSNLKIDWEVPEGYAANTSAKRYLVKLGKIIQLNLKTELLLLNKPPLSNTISVELKYNSAMGKFETVGIKMSSGEKAVDDIILQTVKTALDSSASTNMESFIKLQGNPVLIIHL